MTTNIATIEHVLSSSFIVEAVALSRTTTLDMAAVQLQYSYNEKHNFNRDVLAKPEFNVSITKADVERAVNLYRGVAVKGDNIGLVYNWLREILPMMVAPSTNKAWAKFVAHAKDKNIMGLFAHLSAREVYRLFVAVYNAVAPKAIVDFYA